MEGDKEFGVQTLSVILGKERVSKIFSLSTFIFLEELLFRAYQKFYLHLGLS